MKNLKILVSAILLFAVLAGIGYALTPPPPPPPPVPQVIGLNDTGIDQLITTDGPMPPGTNQIACRQCHQTSGTNIPGGNNFTAAGVPTRHHTLVSRGVKNPLTSSPFGCTDCHPSTPGIGNGILLDRSCVDCHNGTNFWADAAPLNASVGNITRPHHIITNYTSVVGFGNPAADRTCNVCHGSFVANYNDGHYKPTYDTSLMITPFATFKATNFSQPDGLGGNKTWGGCLSCHLPDPTAIPPIGNNHDNHHKEILGFARFGGKTVFQNATTPGETCSWCHVLNPGTTSPLRFNITNDLVSPPELLIRAMELRNSTIEATSVLEPGTTNITVNGTGCEKCHDVRSLHNINAQVPYAQNGPQGKGHIQNNLDCSGCHDSWLPFNDFVPGAIIPTLDSISPSAIAIGTATTLSVIGANFVNGAYTSVVTVDGVTYIPTSMTDSQIMVDIPAQSAGIHLLRVVKGGDTLSKPLTLTVVPAVTLSSATLDGVTLTMSGTGLGNQPTTNAQQYVIVGSAGYAASIASWSDTKIVATVAGSVAIGDTVTVITADSGQAAATIVAAPTPTTITVTSPNGGENWKRGSTHPITWASVGIPTGANIKIELLKGTNPPTVIKSSTPNSGTWSWKIPGTLSKASNYKIRVTNIGTSYTDTSDANFQIS